MRTANSSVRRSFILMGLVLLALLVFAGPALGQTDTSWIASYWNNMDLSGAPAVQIVENQAPDIGWGHESPVPGIRPDEFSARWTASPHFSPGQYRFSVKTDDGARLWVNNQLIIDEWHDSIDETYTSDVDFTTAGPIPIRLDFYENKGNAGIHLNWERIGDVATTGPIRAEYFNNMNLEGAPALVRYEGPGLYHDWGNGSPDFSINSDHFSARYTQTMNLAPGVYQFTAKPDDGMRFWINDQLVIDRWNDSSSDPSTAEVYLPGGLLNFKVEYYDNAGRAIVGLSMTRVDDSASSGGSGGGYGGGDTSSGGSGGSGGGYGGGDSAVVPVPLPPPANSYATVSTTALAMRAGPGSEYEQINTLNGGDVVKLTGLSDGAWVNVHRTDYNFAGWVYSPYLSYNAPAGDPPLSNK